MSRHESDTTPPRDYERRKHPRVQVVYANGNGQANWLVRSALGGLAVGFLGVIAWLCISVIAINQARADDRAERIITHNLLCDVADKLGLTPRSCKDG